jgi:hypothetical protein
MGRECKMVPDINNLIEKIAHMSESKLHKFGWSISTSDLEKESRDKLHVAIEKRLDILRENGTYMVCDSEVSDFGDYE